MRPFSFPTLAPHFSHVRISLGAPGQRSALVAYDSSLRMFVVGTANSHSHHFWSLEGFSRGRSIPSTLAAVLASSIRILEGHPSLPGTDGRIATAVPAPVKMAVVQTPSLSWLRLHLSAPPLGMLLLAAISLPRVTSELAALTLLCVLQASFEGLVCAVHGILQCVVVHGFVTFPAFPRLSEATHELLLHTAKCSEPASATA